MKYCICAYFDTELEKFYPPFLAPQLVEDVTEGILDSFKKGKIEDSEHKKVFYLGDFETADGKITLVEKPRQIVDLTIFGNNA